MMPAAKESWNDLAEIFCGAGYESIAIDLRGHGESVFNGSMRELNYRNFSDKEHQKSILDLEAAVDFLIKEQKAAPAQISFVGASIGANLSLQYVSEHPNSKRPSCSRPGWIIGALKPSLWPKILKPDKECFSSAPKTTFVPAATTPKKIKNFTI